MINGLDLFSGIGGFSVALSPWVRTVAYCEIDHFARSVLLSRMADNQLCRAPIWDDVTALRAADFPAGAIDIITAGFPCQDLSNAGSRRGLDGERSGLYREVIRLVVELRPRFVFLENVAAIRGKGANVVIGDLASLGYDCRWTAFEAAAVGAPHRRDRWWCLASNPYGNAVREQPERQQPERQQCKPPKRRNKKSRDAGQVGGEVLAHPNGGGLASDSASDHKAGSKPQRRDNDGPAALSYWERESAPKPDIYRMDDGLQDRVDRLRVLGNAIVPDHARRAFEILSGIATP